MKHNVQRLLIIPLFASLIIVSTIVIPPIYLLSVPVTLQTFWVMLTGLMLPPKEAFLTLLLYLVLGILGLPVFSRGTSGIGVLFGPTGGFLLAFPIASWGISLGKRHKGMMLNFLITLFFGVGVVYLIALPIYSLHQQANWHDLMMVFGLFMLWDAVKAIGAVWCHQLLMKRLPDGFFLKRVQKI